MLRAQPLRDVVGEGLRLLFVGINPSLRSAEVGHHFAGRGNPFWRLLHAAGLTPTALVAEEDDTLPALGLGITNVCSRPTRSAAELTRAELVEGAAELRTKILSLRPEVVALVGVSLYRLVLPGGGEPGPGAKRGRLGVARVFVLPNPSGLNAAYPGFQDKLVWFRRLRRFSERPGPAGPGPRRASARAGPSSDR